MDLTFLLSIVALLLGPLLFQVARKSRNFLALLDGYIFLAVPGILLFIMAPELIEMSGEPVLIYVAIGFIMPVIFERMNKKLSRRYDRLAAVLGILGLLTHTVIEGSALKIADHANERFALSFQAMVFLHRLPVGLFVWWMLHPLLGKVAALAGLLALVFGTAIGFMAAETVEQLFSASGWSYFQAFVAGSLVHVIFHHSLFKTHGGHHHHKEDHCDDSCHIHHQHHHLFSDYNRQNLSAGIGGLLGVGTIVFLLSLGIGHHGEEVHEDGMFLDTFISLALTSAPALLIGYFFSGFLEEFMPKSTLRFMRSGSSLQQSAKGIMVGLPMPICSCGVVPLYYSLVKKGVPPAAAIAFLIATPELGFDAFLLSFPLLGFEMTMARLLAAGTLAFAVAIFMSRFMSSDVTPAAEEQHKKNMPLPARVKSALYSGFRENLDHTGPWILLGLVLAALLEPFFVIMQQSIPGGFAQVVLFALIGIPFYVCAAGATPLVAVMLAAGVSPGAAMAFLLTGPATNITTFGTLNQLHGPKVAWSFSIAMSFSAIGLGLLTNLVIPVVQIPLGSGHAHGAEWWQLVSLVTLSIVFVNSFLNQGPRNFAQNLIPEKLNTAA